MTNKLRPKCAASWQVVSKYLRYSQEAIDQAVGPAIRRPIDALQPISQRVSDIDPVAAFVDTGDVPHPSSHAERGAVHRKLPAKPVPDGAQQPLRQLLAAVHGNMSRMAFRPSANGLRRPRPH